MLPLPPDKLAEEIAKRALLADEAVRLFSRLVWSTELVVLGVLIEGLPVVHEIVDVVKIWLRRKRERAHLKAVRDVFPASETTVGIGPETRTPAWLKLVAFFGLTCVAVGVAGEVKYEVKYEAEEDAIQTLDNNLAGDAATSAKTAHSELATVKGEVGDVKNSVADAQKSVSAVKGRAKDLLMKYQATEGEVVELKAAKLPRRLSSAQKEIFRRAVSSFTITGSPTSAAFNISCVNPGGNQTQEMLDFELDFKDAIDLKTPVFFQFGLSCQTILGGGSVPPIEVEIGADRTQDGRVLTTALEDIGIKDKDITVKGSDNRALLSLAIGPKPE